MARDFDAEFSDMVAQAAIKPTAKAIAGAILDLVARLAQRVSGLANGQAAILAHCEELGQAHAGLVAPIHLQDARVVALVELLIELHPDQAQRIDDVIMAKLAVADADIAAAMPTSPA